VTATGEERSDELMLHIILLLNYMPKTKWRGIVLPPPPRHSRATKFLCPRHVVTSSFACLLNLSQNLKNMKRVLKPTGSRAFSGAKRVRQQAAVVAVVPRNRFRSRSIGMNGTSLFQPNVSAPEKKNVDLFTSDFWTSATGNWTITPINLIAQGTTAQQHVGRKAVMTSVLARGWLGLTAGAYPVRIVLVYDKETNGAAPIATDIFQTNDSLAPMNLANSDRFIVVGECQPMINTQQITLVLHTGKSIAR